MDNYITAGTTVAGCLSALGLRSGWGEKEQVTEFSPGSDVARSQISPLTASEKNFFY
jgi:hypothetical protein